MKSRAWLLSLALFGLTLPCLGVNSLFSSSAPATPTVTPAPLSIKGYVSARESDTIEVPAGNAATLGLMIEHWQAQPGESFR